MTAGSLTAHNRDHFATADEGSFQVRRDDAVPLLVGSRLDRLDYLNGSVCEQNVDSAEALNCLRDCGLHLVRVGDIGCDGEAYASGTFDFAYRALGRLLVPIEHNHRCLLASEESCARFSNAGSASGDHDYLIVKLSHTPPIVLSETRS